ncbi:quinone-dependent dihydroorotate dehydrogenase [uncultured Alistipes sp.]|uniref:quinone-dependent dihydroorotate dehydrogenase n=1 Tax=uncultured Alistipes sp. TaxID=538949 RepID=UPI0032B16C50
MIYEKIIKPILFRLPIERAHRLTLIALRLIGMVPGGRWLLRKSHAVESPALEREVFGIRFRNPVGLAAGFDVDGDVCNELSALGFGFVEIGTLTPRPQGGNPRPRVFRLQRDRATVNRLGFPNRGLERAQGKLREGHEGTVVGCNIGCNAATPPEKVPADYLKLFRNLYQYVDYFTVNINCDNGTRECQAPTTGRLLEILEPLFDFRRGQNHYRPILLKISPDLTDEEVDRMTDLMIDTPLDGIVAVSGTHHRDGLTTSRQALAQVGGGRLGGAPLKQRAVEVVRRIHERSHGTYPIIGVGGLMTPEDVREMLQAGASLVQLYTGFVYEGPRLVRDICRSLAAPVPAAEKSGEGAE